jgi:penicillin-binding protein 1A
LAGIVALLAFTGTIAFDLSRLPDPALLTLDDRPPNITIFGADGTILAERGLRRGTVPLEQLPPHLVQAVLATEDRRFYSHPGLDPIGIARAAFRNLLAGDVVEGGSTITQQLAKNIFLKPDRTFSRKIEEAICAAWLERRFSKDEILELYLNRVYFGAGTYGIDSAARRYFGKPAEGLSLPQAALLAGLLKAPSRDAPTRNVKRAAARMDVVLDSMVAAGFLTPERARKAAGEPLRLAALGDETGYPYAVDWIIEQLPDYVGERSGDLIVETTIDAGLQRKSQGALRRLLDEEGHTYRASEGAVVVLDPRGGVRALIGGRSYQASPFDRATRALRQPGSAFKPFVYLAAFESGFTPDSLAEDAPVSVGGWSPKNHAGGYRGTMSLRDSFALSVNTVAVRVAENVGRRRVTRIAQRLGIGSALHNQPSIALGTAEVTPLELTAAYAPFANGGEGIKPYAIQRIRNSDGRVLYARKPSRGELVVSASDVASMNDLMRATITRGTGRQAALPDQDAGGKTGTSQNARDAWFVGYTPYYVASVWIGNDDGSQMRHVTGGTLPAQLWREIMLYAHEGKEPAQLLPDRSRWFDEVSHLPWSGGGRSEKLLRRVLGLFSGG